MVKKTSRRYPFPFLTWGDSRHRLDFSCADPDAPAFPPDFLFGAATAAHQVEGDTTNNWTRWEETTRRGGRPPCIPANGVGPDGAVALRVLRLAAHYGKPIYITENGTCDAEIPDRRRRFLLECLYAVEQAIRNGIDVRGYLHWSLLDNFEWAYGFVLRFGLYRVDYETQERMLISGGERYRHIITAHRDRRMESPDEVTDRMANVGQT